jgi:hypothetical protein
MDDPVFTSAVFYRDPKAALRWLEQAFGFEITMATDGPPDAPEMCHYEMSCQGRPDQAEWERITDAVGPKPCNALCHSWSRNLAEEADHAHAEDIPRPSPKRSEMRLVMSTAEAFSMSVGARGLRRDRLWQRDLRDSLGQGRAPLHPPTSPGAGGAADLAVRERAMRRLRRRRLALAGPHLRLRGARESKPSSLGGYRSGFVSHHVPRRQAANRPPG